MNYGMMMGEDAALELLEVEVADAVLQGGLDVDQYARAVNRIRYRFDQCKPVEPKFHKGIYGKKYDSYSCGYCGFGGMEVHFKYCPNCGYMIGWKR